jgi:hypothetical protein
MVVISRNHQLTPVVDEDNDPNLNLAMRFESLTVQETTPPGLQGLSERMMGLEPTTFCMAKGSWVRPI